MYSMEIMVKISFVITLMLTAIMIIDFDCFQMSFSNYQGHINFRKELSKNSQSAR